MPRIRRASQGMALIKMLGLVLLTLMFSALAIDMGMYFAAQNQLQTAANASALAATLALQQTDGEPEEKQDAAVDAATALTDDNLGSIALLPEDVEFGFADPANNFDFSTGPTADPDYEPTGGFNAVRVTARANADTSPFPTLMANLFGVDSMDAAASAVAVADNTLGEIAGGLRPIYGCQNQFDLARADGDLSNDTIRIYGDNFQMNGSSVSCPLPGPGNWGFADLRDCSPGSVGASTIADWFENGYPGTVTIGECYSTKPGNFISSGPVENAIKSLRDNGTVIMIPLADDFQGSGSNSKVTVSGIAGFVITGYKANGSASSRYIEGRFETATCPSTMCTPGDEPGSGGGSVIRLKMINGT